MKVLVSVVIGLMVLTLIPTAFGQITVGEPAHHKLITMNLGEEGQVHVIHEIRRVFSPVHVEVLEGTLSNLSVIDEEGNSVEYAETGVESTTGVTIFSSKEDVFVEYDLDEVLFFEDGLWKIDYFNVETTKIIFPEGVDLLFVNDRPVLLHDAKGITCFGKSNAATCDAFIEYVIDEPTQSIEIEWEQQKFFVGMRTLEEIPSLDFDQPSKKISFDVSDAEPLVTLIIPLELLWEPYEVFLNDEKILKHEFFSNETHSWLNIRPENSGTVEIIGTTVVPEFPILAPLVVGIAFVVILQLKNRFNLH